VPIARMTITTRRDLIRPPASPNRPMGRAVVPLQPTPNRRLVVAIGVAEALLVRDVEERRSTTSGEGFVSAPDETVWFISRDGQRVGPLTAEEFAQFDEMNRLRPTDQVWHAGMPAWIAYRDYAMREAAARFANPARPSSSARTSRPHALANTLQGTLRRVASRLAGLRTVFIRTRDEDGASARAFEGRPRGALIQSHAFRNQWGVTHPAH
jgi:hypothetical protein